jgi:hypothetical protein
MVFLVRQADETADACRNVVSKMSEIQGALRDPAPQSRDWPELNDQVRTATNEFLEAARAGHGGIITAALRDWFTRSEPPLRTALGLAESFHGNRSDDVKRTVLDEVGQSLRWITRSGRLIGFVPTDSPFPEPAQEPYIDSHVPDAIRVAELLRSGAEEHTRDFVPVFGFLLTLMESGGRTIDWPT